MEQDIRELIEKNRKKENRKELQNAVKQLTKEIEKAHRIINLYELAEDNKKPIEKIIRKKFKHKDEGTVLTLLSDVHAEERVELEQTNGINEYNPDICKARLERYAVNLVKLTERNREMIVLDNLVLAVLGDLIHGFIHEEYQISNYMMPPEAALFVIEELERVITFILEHGKFKKIVIICKIGNHSRTTDKIYSDNEAKMSYEWTIYKVLQKKFPTIEWIIENSYFTYYQIYDLIGRFHHGHGFKYMGGIGGIYVPLQKFRLRVDQQRKADFNCFGHWHSMDSLRNSKTLINGSVVGFDTYATRKGFEPEPPQQQFQIVDSKRGLTVNAPIILS